MADWDFIVLYQILSKDFIREFQDRVYWGKISKSQVLSESFIPEFKDRVKWSYICSHQNLSEHFIRKFRKQVDLYYILRRQEISEKLREEILSGEILPPSVIKNQTGFSGKRSQLIDLEED
jgi:hypothetical protein